MCPRSSHPMTRPALFTGMLAVATEPRSNHLRASTSSSRCVHPPSPKLMPTAPPDHCAPVLPQAAGALPLSSTSCCRRTLAHKQGLQVQTTLPLNTLFGGVPEELLGRAARAAQGCCSWSQAAGRAVGTRWAGHLSGEAGRAHRESRGCRVGFQPSAHLRGPRRHVRASG